MLREQYRQVISTVVAMNAIGLTDAFGFTDRELNTALGNKDGNPYEALWNSAQKNPLNSDESKEKFAVSVIHAGRTLVSKNNCLFISSLLSF